jgi:hypothetical protein
MGQHSDSTEQIHTELQDVTQTLRWNAFQQCFPSRKSCWKHCINAEGDYFKGHGSKYKFQVVVKLWQRNFGNFCVAPHMKFSKLWNLRFRSSETWSCVMCVPASATMWMRSALFWGMQRRVVIPYWCFEIAYQSCVQGSRSPRRMLWTRGYIVYMEKGVATDRFSVSMMPTHRADTSWRRWEGGEKSTNLVLLWDKMACLPHTASTILAGITLIENQSLPTPFPI